MMIAVLLLLVSCVLGASIEAKGSDVNVREQMVGTEFISASMEDVQQAYAELQHDLVTQYGPNNMDVFTMRIPNEASIRARFLDKIRKGEPIIFSFTGTSVTAGHDNYFSDSYPFVFQRLFNEVVRSAGSSATVRNQAMGNNPILPYDMCLETVAGSDPDVVAWEQGMMCGKHGSHCVEFFTRNAATLKSNPAVLIIDAVPDVEQTPRTAEILQHLFRRDELDLHDLYQHSGFHSYISFANLRNKESDPLFSKQRMMEEGKPFEDAKAWHPGKYGHQLVGQALALTYGRIFLDALGNYHALSQSSDPKMLANFIKGQKGTTTLPDPMWPTMPPTGKRCLTTFEPKVKQDNELHKFVTRGEVVYMRPEVQVPDIETGKWTLGLWAKDVHAVQRVIEENRGYLDRKWSLMGNKDSGRITFSIKTKSVGTILICMPPESYSGYPEGFGDLMENVNVYLGSEKMEFNRESMGPCFESVHQVSKGKHNVHVVPKTMTAVAITHLIFE